ncbi:16S rRNA (uracil(1498)-N(3))-methyltransferase [bacterium]|nr:16S rRNA (uracil(1498)-N(3))-methyltransferase [bacterium]
MPRNPFIIAEEDIKGSTLRITGSEAAHLRRVLRAQPGFKITGFNGRGDGWLAEITSIGNHGIQCRIIEPLPSEVARNTHISIAVGVIKGQRMDWAIEKCSELGADVFIPLLTDFSVVEPGKNKIERWQSIAIASAKQSRRLRLMSITEPIKLSDFIDTPYSGKLISDKSNKMTIFALDNGINSIHFAKLKETILRSTHVTVLVGPEGGFSDNEIELLTSRSIRIVSFGKRPLRTETATTVILGQLNDIVEWK